MPATQAAKAPDHASGAFVVPATARPRPAARPAAHRPLVGGREQARWRGARRGGCRATADSRERFYGAIFPGYGLAWRLVLAGIEVVLPPLFFWLARKPPRPRPGVHVTQPTWDDGRHTSS
ncbi:hypothetical protein [Amycolatopsis viridis]|uniref:Uncharacterized protein n=1 Tax=Amycolatopsis viridis TaxID=185678 RepID=A0ABX0T195_9PSEU|nr:hypothetical protein [Amycolatopsis viridis]NIH82605.1 hypothetical protein [Amycolatopsis viridis]